MIDEWRLESFSMVEKQILSRGIKDSRVLEAMRNTPRHLFVGDELRDMAYNDCPLPFLEGQTVSQPYMVAYMTEKLEFKGCESVLEIGTGSGYQTAILAQLAREVYTIERIESLSLAAQKNLARQELANIHFHIGDGTLGWRDFAPYDRIIITAAAPTIPEILRGQMNMEDSIMAVPVGSKSYQVLTLIRMHKQCVDIQVDIPCIFVPLIGKEGY